MMQLCEQFKRVSAEESAAQQDRVAGHLAGFVQCVSAVRSGVPFESACAGFVTWTGVTRCYLLDQDAVQISENLTPPSGVSKTDARFLPLEDVAGARWFRRHYFRRAIADPGKVHMSRPYLSLTGTGMCVTLAIGVRTGGGALQVLRCDLDCE